MAHVELVSLTKRYNGIASVEGVDLRVEKGEFICLLGPSGCGKTTTLRMLAGFLEPDGGEIRVNGKRVSAPGSVVPPERRNMGMIFQSYAIWPHMTVLDNVAYGLKMQKVPAAERQKRARDMLAATRLTDHAEQVSRRALGRPAAARGARPRARTQARTSCCSTSRSPTSTPTCAARCASRSAACTTSSTTPPST